MTDSEAAQVASFLSVDANYLAECLERFRGLGEVRIPVKSAEVLVANTRLAIRALEGTGGESVSAVDHPSLKAAADLQAAREAAEQQMSEANHLMKHILDSVKRGE